MKKKLIVFFIILMIGLMGISSYATQELPENYDLRDSINIEVKNQFQTDTCIPASISSMFETYVKLKRSKGELDIFNDDVVFSGLTASYDRDVGHNIIPLEDVENVIKNFYNNEITSEQMLYASGDINNQKLLYEIQKIKPQYQIVNQNGDQGKLYNLDVIKKDIQNGQVIYKNNNDQEISIDEVKAIRNTYKEYIMNNGGIRADIDSKNIQTCYDTQNSRIIKVSNTNTQKITNHSVLVIGWDDNFSKMNFPEEIRPTGNGAYIVQNSWGDSWGNNGIFYISYEDINIEKSMQGVFGISELEDKSEPKIYVEKDGNNYSITVLDKYGSGLKTCKYIFTEHNIEPNLEDEAWELFDDTGELNIQDDGKYIWVYAIDNVGNEILKSIKEDKKGLLPIFYSKYDYLSIIKDIPDEIEDIYISSEEYTDEELNDMLTIEKKQYGGWKITSNTIGEFILNVSGIKYVDGKRVETRAQKVICTFQGLPEVDERDPMVVVYEETDDNGNPYFMIITADYESGMDKVVIEVCTKDGEEYIEEINNPSNLVEYWPKKNGMYLISAYDVSGNSSSKLMKVDYIEEDKFIEGNNEEIGRENSQENTDNREDAEQNKNDKEKENNQKDIKNKIEKTEKYEDNKKETIIENKENNNKNDNNYVEDIITEKDSEKEEKSIDNNSPQTGDNLVFVVIILAVATCLLGAIMGIKKL